VLVVSGINNGANLGDDVAYSGTVAGAHEGMLLGIPSIAVSNVSFFPEHLETSGRYARIIAEYCLDHGLPSETMLNVNVPDVPPEAIMGITMARMGRGAYLAEIIEREDPRGVAYYWIGGTKPEDVATPGSDFEAVARHEVSVTPLRRDLTSETGLDELNRLPFKPTKTDSAAL
jgi:5'-nucleotidase